MKISGWRNGSGSCAGYWLICDFPGLMAHRSELKGTWALMVADGLYNLHPKDPRRVWGQSANYSRAIALLRDNPELKREFRTRRDLLEALQRVMAPDALPEQLSL